MRGQKLQAFQTAWLTLFGLTLAGLIGWAQVSKAEFPSVSPRAVESLNFTGLAEFQVAQENQPGGQDTTTGKTGLFGGWVTAPLGDHFGVRLALDGGIETLSSAPRTISPSLLNAGGDLFLRNPRKGYVQLGYRWNGSWWDDQTDLEVGDFMASDHRLRYQVGLFHGDYDLEFGVEYLRLTSEATATILSTGNSQSFAYPSRNGFRLLSGSAWYVADSLALGFDVEWGRTRATIASDNFPKAHRDRFQVRLGADWQPRLVGLEGNATVGLSVGIGYQGDPVVTTTTTLPPGAGTSQTESTLRNVYSFSYHVRLGVTVYFPSTSSLKERTRQYQ